jgi:hypothetical protein
MVASSFFARVLFVAWSPESFTYRALMKRLYRSQSLCSSKGRASAALFWVPCDYSSIGLPTREREVMSDATEPSSEPPDGDYDQSSPGAFWMFIDRTGMSFLLRERLEAIWQSLRDVQVWQSKIRILASAEVRIAFLLRTSIHILRLET